MSSRTRFPELDLLRFLAACGVMLYHYTYHAPRHHLSPDSFPLLGQIFKYGYLGVDAFFILSGFVILLTAYDKDAVGFTVARIVRLYPAYWICVTLTTLAVVLTGTGHSPITLGQYLANLTMVHGFFGIGDVSGVYWTLAVELQFYFLIFLLLAAGQVRRIAYFLGLWLFASIVISLRPPHGIAHFFLIPEWSSYFIAGAMLFLIHREGPTAYKLAVIGACFVLSVAYAVGWLPFATGKLENGFSASTIASVLAVAYAAFLVIALRPRGKAVMPCATSRRSLLISQKGEGRGGRQPIVHNPHVLFTFDTASLIKILGLITYPLYLLHQDLGLILMRAAPSSLNRLVLLSTVVMAIMLLSWFVHIGPEKWLTVRLKSLLARPEQLAISIKTLVAERLAAVTLKAALPKQVIPTVVPARVTELPPGAQSPGAAAQPGNAATSL